MQAERNSAVAHHVGGDERARPGTPLGQRERDQEHHAEGEQAQDARVGPAPGGYLIQREQQRHQAQRQGGYAQVVDPLPAGVGLGLGHRPPGDEAGRRRHGKVHEQDRPPADQLGQRPAHQRSRGVPESRRAEDQPARQPRLVGGENGVGHAQHRGPHHRPADAHQPPADDQPEIVGGEGSQDGEESEDPRSEEEDQPPAEHVGQPPAGHDQHAEDQRVDVDHPLDAGDVGVEVLLDVGQGDAEGREVVGDDEHRHRHRPQRHQRAAVQTGHARSTVTRQAVDSRPPAACYRDSQVDFRLLGPLEVSDGSRPLSIGAGRQRALLALLLLRANELVTSDRLVEELWGESPPATAQKMLHNQVSALRRALGRNGRLETQGSGYRLEGRPGRARRRPLRGAGRSRTGADRRGSRGGGRDAPPSARPLARTGPLRPRLRAASHRPRSPGSKSSVGPRSRRAARRSSSSAATPTLVGELEAAVVEQPLRERLRAQLMLALYRCGRQAEALDGLPAGAGDAGRGGRDRAGRRAARPARGDPRPGSRARPAVPQSLPPALEGGSPLLAGRDQELARLRERAGRGARGPRRRGCSCTVRPASARPVWRPSWRGWRCARGWSSSTSAREAPPERRGCAQRPGPPDPDRARRAEPRAARRVTALADGIAGSCFSCCKPSPQSLAGGTR